MRSKLLAIIACCCLLSAQSQNRQLLISQNNGSVPIALVGTPVAIGTGATGPTTSGTMNTTGATMLAACVASNTTVAGSTVTDSQGNDWILLTEYGAGGVANGGSAQLFYAYKKGAAALSTSSTHTITVTSIFGYGMFTAYSGTLTYPTDPLDSGKVNGSANGGLVASIATGSITPSASGELIASCFGGYTGNETFTVDNSLTIDLHSALVGGTNYGGAFAHRIYNSASAINPTWSLGSGTDSINAGIAAFKHP